MLARGIFSYFAVVPCLCLQITIFFRYHGPVIIFDGASASRERLGAVGERGLNSMSKLIHNRCTCKLVIKTLRLQTCIQNGNEQLRPFLCFYPLFSVVQL